MKIEIIKTIPWFGHAWSQVSLFGPTVPLSAFLDNYAVLIHNKPRNSICHKHLLWVFHPKLSSLVYESLKSWITILFFIAKCLILLLFAQIVIDQFCSLAAFSRLTGPYGSTTDRLPPVRRCNRRAVMAQFTVQFI